MKNIDLTKAAADFAYTTVAPAAFTPVQLDIAIGEQSQTLQLTDAEYGQFKQLVGNFRSPYLRAASQDAQIAAQAANAAAQALKAQKPNVQTAPPQPPTAPSAAPEPATPA